MSYYGQPSPSSTYPYATYHPVTPGAYGHPQAAGTYSTYQAGAYGSGVTGYGSWPNYYSYIPPQSQQSQQSKPQQQFQQAPLSFRPVVQGAVPGQTVITPPVAIPPKTTTFSAYNPSHARESVLAAGSGGATTSRGRKQLSYKGLFAKELRNLMYGFGDDRNPANDTVNVMEEILVEYIIDVCQVAGGGPQRKSRLSIEDLRRALSRPADAKKLARMDELLFMQEVIKRARSQFDEPDANQTRDF